LMYVRYTHHGSLEAVWGVGRTIPLGLAVKHNLSMLAA